LPVIALIVVLITVRKLHPFLALIFGAIAVGSLPGQNPGDVLDSFGKGFARHGGKRRHTDRPCAFSPSCSRTRGRPTRSLTHRRTRIAAGACRGQWRLVGAIIGCRVLRDRPRAVDAVIYLVAKRSQLSLITVRNPRAGGLFRHARAGASAPGAVTAIGLLHADLGVTLAWAAVRSRP